MNMLYCVTWLLTASSACVALVFELWRPRKALIFPFTSNGPLKKANKLQVSKEDCG